MPEKLAQMKEMFLIEAAKNKALPIGGGLWVVVLHPEQRITPPYTEWTFSGDTVRMPEFCAPALGQQTQRRHHRRRSSRPMPTACSTTSARTPAASPASWKTAFSATNTTSSSSSAPRSAPQEKLPDRQGEDRSRDELRRAQARRPAEGDHEGRWRRWSPKAPCRSARRCLFTANDCLDIGIALGSPVSLDYCDKAPFKFNGTIEQVHVKYVTAQK